MFPNQISGRVLDKMAKELDVRTNSKTAMKIYIASKTKHASEWRGLRAAGAPIVSSWIDETGVGETQSLSELANRCLIEAASADCLIFYSDINEQHQGALVECGAALANGKPIICVSPSCSESSIFSTHRQWFEASSMEQAIELAKKLRINQFGRESCNNEYAQ